MRSRLALFLLLTLLPAAPALADQTSAPATNVEKAREVFAWGQRLYKQARYAEAALKFEEAYLLRPHPVLQYNIGRCYEQLGELPRAMRSYKDYLRLMPEAKDKEAVTDAILNIERRMQEKGVQQVLVFAEPASAVILVDGKTLGTSPASVELAPGNHQVTVKASGYEEAQRSFILSAQRSIELSFSLKALNPVVAAAPDKPVQPAFAPNEFPPPPPPPLVVATVEPPPRQRVMTWVVGGAALLAGGTALGLYGAAIGQGVELRRMPRPGDQQQMFLERIQSFQTGALIAGIVAGAAAVTAIVLFFIEGR